MNHLISYIYLLVVGGLLITVFLHAVGMSIGFLSMIGGPELLIGIIALAIFIITYNKGKRKR